MFNKLYVRTIGYIKENYKWLIVNIIIFFVLIYPIPYYIEISGGISDVNKRINIENSPNKKGSFNYSYVSEIRGTTAFFLLSYIIPDWELVKINDIKEDNETLDIMNYRDKMAMEESIQTAQILAYKKANKEISLLNPRHYVIYISNLSNTNLEVRDEILDVNNLKINNIDDFVDVINKTDIGNDIVLKVKNNNKIEYKHIKVFNDKEVKRTGIYFITLYDIKCIPNITLTYSSKESGSSAGLMLTLGIYNKLIDNDITKGFKIAGTGTIDRNGNVGEIGGVYYKLKGAVKGKADVFLVPAGDNYKEAMKYKNKYNYKIKIVAVKTFDDALNYLKSL